MPKLQTITEISEEDALDCLGEVLSGRYTRFGEGDNVRLNKRAAPRPGDTAVDSATGTRMPAQALPSAIAAVLRRGTVGVIAGYFGRGPHRDGEHEQDIYEVLVLGADGRTYSVSLPQDALMPYAPRQGAATLDQFAARASL